MAVAAAKIPVDFADGNGAEKVGNMEAPVPAEVKNRPALVAEEVLVAVMDPGGVLPSVFADRIRPAGEYSGYT